MYFMKHEDSPTCDRFLQAHKTNSNQSNWPLSRWITLVCISVFSPSFSPAADLLLSDEASETTSDLMLAKMLQMQFDREFDDQLRREEKKFNGESKGTTTRQWGENTRFDKHNRIKWVLTLTREEYREVFQIWVTVCLDVCVQCPSPLRTTGWFIRMKTATALRTRWTGRTRDTTPTKQVTGLQWLDRITGTPQSNTQSRVTTWCFKMNTWFHHLSWVFDHK